MSSLPTGDLKCTEKNIQYRSSERIHCEAKTYLPKFARVGLYLCVITLFTAAKPTAHLLQKKHPDKSVYQQKVIEATVTFWCCVFLVFGVSVGFKILISVA